MIQRVDKDSLPLNQPRRTPNHPTKSHIVKTKVDGKEKIIRFGEQGASTAGKPKAGESDRMKAKRASFKARHAKNIAKGKSSPAYWANKVKWADGGAVSLGSLAAKYDDGGEVRNLPKERREAQSALRDISPTWWKDIKSAPPQKPAGQQIADVLSGVSLPLSAVPVVGDVAGLAADAAMYAAYPEERTMLNAGMSLAGLLPFVPGAAGVRAAKKSADALDMSQADSKISALKELVRQRAGEYAARRVERAADEIPNLGRQYSDEALRSAFMGDNTQLLMTMPPDSFEDYAARLIPDQRYRVEDSDDRLAFDDYINYLGKIARGNGLRDVPYLKLTDPKGIGDLEILSHEGRHRTQALTRLGDDSTLIRLYPEGYLREMLPRQDREGFFEAFRDYLGEDAPLVRPEQELDEFGESLAKTRPKLRLPEPYADGGLVSMADKYAEGGEVSVEDLIARLESATPLERQTYETLGMEPGLDRATFLPIAGSRSGGDLQMAVPQFIYDIGKAFVTPGAAMQGVPLSYEDVVNMAGNTMGGGLAISSPVEGAVAGMAIKRKGGNWLDKSIAGEIAPLRSRVVGQDPARRIEDLEAAYAQNVEAGVPVDEVFMQRERERLMPDIAINRWLDTKLNKYIRNEMGTPEDPVRALAESGTLHTQPRRLGPQDINELRHVREMEGFPGAGLGQSELAQRWEDVADSSILSDRAGDLISPSRYGSLLSGMRLEADPWLSKVPPETPVYRAGSMLTERTGFNHLVDELKNAMDPNSPLPRNLRIDPKDIDKITVPQAVERVAKINDWRAQEAVRAEREGMMANLQGAPRVEVPELNLSFTEKPGGKWVDIPETVDESGLKLCTSIGKAGGWCTQGEGLAKSYGSGDHRLAALVDAEGRPHAQAKISASRVDVDRTQMAGMLDDEDAIADQVFMNAANILQERGMGRLFDEDVDTDVLAEALASANPRGLSREARDALNDVYAEAEARLPKTALPTPDITELKPPGNSFNSERAKEYIKRDPQYKQKVTESVLKFLNSGDWGKVNQDDLDMYRIVDLNDSNAVFRYLGDIYYGSDNTPATAEMIFNAATDAAPMDTPRFMSRGQFINFLEPFEPMPPEGFAKGGAVRKKGYAQGGSVYDPSRVDQIMNSINTPRNYASGGSVLAYDPGRVDAILNQFRGAVV